MNNAVEIEGRPRPLSAGIWTLFSWLRRDDRSDSTNSLSSAGSDRTVASFAFLTPAHYHPATTPLVLPPQGPPTDSYKKRVNDRNLRRQYDYDITLHRKYGLFKSGENTCGYDAFSLPSARKLSLHADSRWDRDRRATSESIQRRLAHVPGKRRAPLPPALKDSAAYTRSVTRHSTRKRRAPLPPVKLIENKENIKDFEGKTVVTQMNPNLCHNRPTVQNDLPMDCKPEKYSKKEKCNKDTKHKSEKNFLKQIFDNKKRNSGIDVSAVKYLPSISELDKQATEIIENCKLNASEHNSNLNVLLKKHDTQDNSQTETWICVSCLKKYDSLQLNCINCLPKQTVKPFDRAKNDASSTTKASNCGTQTDDKLKITPLINRSTAGEKQKLKDMLKEIKDSLPKNSKHDLKSKKENNTEISVETRRSSLYSIETPTLRVGCTTQDQNKTPGSHNFPITTSETQQPTVQSALPVPITIESKIHNNNIIHEIVNVRTMIDASVAPNNHEVVQAKELKDCKDLHTPLKISSLLNPVYVPKNIETNMQTGLKSEKKVPIGIIVENANKISRTTGKFISTYNPLPDSSTSYVDAIHMGNKNVENKSKIEMRNTDQIEPQKSTLKDDSASVDKGNNPLKVISGKILTSPLSTNQENQQKDITVLNQHSRRRNLIHQLEQSIAKGNESAAAEAAAKLAQLRLSCSVLSFSSQILSEPSTSAATTSVDTGKINSNLATAIMKVPNEKVKKESQKLQLTSGKERSPQKVVANSSNMIVTPVVHKVTAKDGTQKNNQESVIKNILDGKTKNPIRRNDTMVTISVLVEDREATRGPIQIRVRREAIMKDLRREAETSLGLATNLQRWIIGRALCVDDNTPITTLAGSDFNAPFYLCVVESETKADSSSQTKSGATSEAKIVEKLNNDKNKPQSTTGNVYTELVQLEQQALVPNPENFECGVCMEEYLPGRGAVLRECVHIFCIDCLADVVRHCEEPDIPCPAMGCRGMLQEREIRALVTPQDYERWLARGLAAAESGTQNAFHCRTRDCKGWALCEPGVQRFPCPVCKYINCVPCQTIHNGETCEQYRNKLKQAAANNNSKAAEADDGTRTLLNSLIAKGEALECPECNAVITKKWGCDWVKCSACKTEICWVTRGRRWGPGGKGDTSGGCRCGVDGKRCHPSCGYCH